MNSPPVVVQNNTVRDAVIAAITGLLVLGFIGYGIVHFAQQSTKAKANTLTGMIVDREFIPAPEQQIEVGNRGLKTQRVDGEYLLKVRVDSEGGRIFDVPVQREVYEAKQKGDSLSFLRPPSERQ